MPDRVNWAYMACEAMELSPAEAAVLAFLTWRANQQTGLAYPSRENIRSHTRLSIATIRRALPILLKMGLIEDTGRRMGHTQAIVIYRVTGAAQDWTWASPEPLQAPFQTALSQESPMPGAGQIGFASVEEAEDDGETIPAHQPPTDAARTPPAPPSPCVSPQQVQLIGNIMQERRLTWAQIMEYWDTGTEGPKPSHPEDVPRDAAPRLILLLRSLQPSSEPANERERFRQQAKAREQDALSRGLPRDARTR